MNRLFLALFNSVGSLLEQYFSVVGRTGYKARRRLILRTAAITTLSGCFIIFLIRYTEILQIELVRRIIGPHPLPPLYEEFREAELQLPQHVPNGRARPGQKYLWIASHADCAPRRYTGL